MSQGPENRYRDSIHRLLPRELHHEKMHNPYRGGTFDDWYSGNKADIWVEYKWKELNLSPLQAKWGKARFTEGRKVYVIVGNKNGGVLYKAPNSWESGVGGTHMAKAVIAAWLVDQTMETQPDADSTKTRSPRKQRGQRIQNTNNGSADIRVNKIQSTKS